MLVFLIIIIILIVYLTVFITRKYKHRQLQKKLEELNKATQEGGSDNPFENDTFQKFSLLPAPNAQKSNDTT